MTILISLGMTLIFNASARPAVPAPVEQPGLGLTPAAIYGTDDRNERTTPNVLTRRVGLLISYYSKNQVTRCTASFVAKDLLLTAAHCLVQEGTGEDPYRVTFDPGTINGKNTHFPREFASGYWLHKDFLKLKHEHVNRKISHEIIEGDLAVVQLKKIANRKHGGDRLGWYGTRSSNIPGEKIAGFTMGYPRDKGENTLWTADCTGEAHATSNYFMTDCDTIKGQIGSGFFVYDKESEDWRIRAVWSAGNDKHSLYTRLNMDFLGDFRKMLDKGTKAKVDNFTYYKLNDTPSYYLHFKNKCHKKIWLAVKLKSAKNNKWTGRGWYTVEPGETANVDFTTSAHFYYYAQDKEAKYTWDGKHRQYVGDSVRKKLRMKKITTPSYFHNYTRNLTCY